jgi:hypothetical protein
MEVLRIKNAYEKMIRQALNGRIRHFFIDKETEKGRANYDKFARIAVWCRGNHVSSAEFLSVMFTLRFGGPSGSKWTYPYLDYLASEAAFTLFFDRQHFLRRVYASSKAAAKAMSPLNYERLFTNCFFDGLPLLHSAVERDGLDKVKRVRYLAQVFLAFPEVFTVEFLVTHSKFAEFQQALVQMDNDLSLYLSGVTKEVLARIERDHSYLALLTVARRAVAKRERAFSQKVHGSWKEWGDLWQLLE